MKRYVPLIGVAAVGLAAPAAAGTARPALEPLALQPLSVEGVHFQPGEWVVVIVMGGAGRASRRVTSGADGAWRVTFPTLKANGRAISIRATGNKGSAALWWPRLSRPTVSPSANR